MMQVKNLSFHYKGCPDVLKDVSFDMEHKEEADDLKIQ